MTTTEDFTRSDPHDIDAERAVLSAMLNSPEGIDAATEMLAADDFYRPAHQVLYDALVIMRAAGEAVTIASVRDWVARQGDSKAIGGARDREYLFGLYQADYHWTIVGSHAGIVRDRAARRRWLACSARIEQMARTTPDADDLAAEAGAEAEAASVFAGEYSTRATRLAGLGEFTGLAKPDPVIPDMVNRMDRVVVVGGGGSGKTILALQVGAAASVGIHPFGRERFTPARVLFIDLEMPPYLLQDELELVMRTARYYGTPEDTFQVIHRPRGIDLGQPGQARILAGLIRKAAPDLIIAGPVYKMHGDTGERSEHTQVMNFWDDIRDRHGCALWLETHPSKETRFGKGPLSPSGSHRWADWCEFGFGLIPAKDDTVDVVPFRGKRDRSRSWPVKLTVNIGGGWPWQAAYPQGTFGDPS